MKIKPAESIISWTWNRGVSSGIRQLSPVFWALQSCLQVEEAPHPEQITTRFSGPLFGPLAADHGPLASDQGFMSDPIGFMLDPLADCAAGGIFSGLLDYPSHMSASSSNHFHRSLSQTLTLCHRRQLRPRHPASFLRRGAVKAITCTISPASKLRAKSSPINSPKTPKPPRPLIQAAAARLQT
ncbi:uncharacterized protein [Elaeis guineensis]|uniref:uncharacterized protein n=1 Tax=Elaeis guineensis var. tenera TaxID=51953 RepID=UPI003C6D9B25